MNISVNMGNTSNNMIYSSIRRITWHRSVLFLESKKVKKIDSDENIWVIKINSYSASRFPIKITFSGL